MTRLSIPYNRLWLAPAARAAMERVARAARRKGRDVPWPLAAHSEVEVGPRVRSSVNCENGNRFQVRHGEWKIVG